MSDQSSVNNKRIAKNTILLYFRMLFMMIVSLYASRVILNALGVEDFGIYNVVGGVVAMFTVISGSLSASISRFITYELGKENQSKLNRIFSTSVTIQLLLSLIIVVLIESVGVWFLNSQMTIPTERMMAANWVLQLSIITFVLNLISVPYNAVIIAHEKMSAFAYISILEALGKLAVAFLIVVSPIDKLIFYAILMCLVAAVVRLTYGYYCKKHFAECTYHFRWDKTLLKKMIGFAGWNFIGASAGVLRTQGVNVVINLFYGATINAARGISVQVNTAVTSFANNFMTAMNPQITKSYSSGDYAYMNKLLFQGSKMSFYMLSFLSLPIIIETETILSFWLKLVPEHSCGFVRTILIFAMCEAISSPMITAMLATGNIKKYQIVVGGTNLLNLPISYVLLKVFGFQNFPEITMVVAIVLSVVCLIQRLFMLRDMINFDSIGFVKRVLLKIILVSLFSMILPLFMKIYLEQTMFNAVICILACMVSSMFFIFYVGCSLQERMFVINKVKQICKKIR